MDTSGAVQVKPEMASRPGHANGNGGGVAGGPSIQFVGFRLAEVDYAFEIRRIQEIILPRPITRIPQMPAWIEGLINLRGAVIPVVRLRSRFELPERTDDDETRVIVLNVGTRTVGVVVDSVSRVLRLSPDQIQPAPLTIDAAERASIQGVARMEERLIVILDVNRLFPEEGLAKA